MALSLAEQLQRVGMPTEQARLLADAISSAGTVSWAEVSGTQIGVEAAVAAKTEIAALNSGSDAAAIVAALKA